MLIYGIPEFRLPKVIVQAEVELPQEARRRVRDGLCGRPQQHHPRAFDDEGYDAVFIGTGAGLPSFMEFRVRTSSAFIPPMST